MSERQHLPIREFASDAPHPRVIVAGHERSGNHFLINTLAQNFGYLAEPRIDLDPYRINVDADSPERLGWFLRALSPRRLSNIIKSHHSADFFSPLADVLAAHYHVIYIHRHPATTLRSFWRMTQQVTALDTGPPCSCHAFPKQRPTGKPLRYQKDDADSWLHRWKHHVEGWLQLASAQPGILVLRYEDLDMDHPGTTARIGDFLGLATSGYRRPDRATGVILPSEEAEYASSCPLHGMETAWFETVTGTLLEQLDYDLLPPGHT
ncbi:MAG: sulfotransferase domain-containing protein [Gammaproteobacteria bacterium]